MGDWKGKPDFVMTAVADSQAGVVPKRSPDEYVSVEMGETAGEAITAGAWFSEDVAGDDVSVRLIGVQIMDAYIPANALSHMVGWDTISGIEDEYRQQLLDNMGGA